MRAPPLQKAARRNAQAQRLALAELEAATSALLSVLLAFLHARIAREETVGAQRRTQLRIQHCKRARKPHAHRSSLSARAAALYHGAHFELILHLRERQRLRRRLVPRHVVEIFFHRASVHGELRGAGLDVDTRDRLTPTARAIVLLHCALKIIRRAQCSPSCCISRGSAAETSRPGGVFRQTQN